MPDLRTFRRSGSSRATATLALIATLTALYAARELFVPLMAGVFLNLLLSPAVRFLRRHLRLPAFVGAVLVLGVFCASLAVFIYQLSGPTREWVEQVPGRWSDVEDRLRDLKQPIADIQEMGRKVEEVTDLETDDNPWDEPPVETVNVQNSDGGGFSDTLSQGGAATVTVLVVLLFVFLTLSTGESSLNGVVRALPRLEDKKRAVVIVRTIETQVSRYLLTISIINASLGLSVAIAMWLLGLPNPALWGAVAFLFNFVPYAGAVAGIGIVALASLLTFDTVPAILTPPLVYMGLTALEGYVITPMAVGRSLSLEPVVVFVAVFFWGWLWGIVGAFLAVPIVIVAKIVFDNIGSLNGFGRLLGPPSKTVAEPCD